jgi:hypothetical protein
MTRSALAALLAVALLAASGCGDDTKTANDYVAATNDVVTTFESTFSTLQGDFTATSTPQQDVRTLDRFGTAVQAAVRDLRTIRPPTKVSALHARLVTAVAAYASIIKQAKKGFVSDDARAVIAARTRFAGSLTDATTKITAQIEAINRKLQS